MQLGAKQICNADSSYEIWDDYILVDKPLYMLITPNAKN